MSFGNGSDYVLDMGAATINEINNISPLITSGMVTLTTASNDQFLVQYNTAEDRIEVAEVLGIHVGTVSRAVSGKYMQTPIGIYPLRYFFSGGTETDQGQSVSWDAVNAKLQEIIDSENKTKP